MIVKKLMFIFSGLMVFISLNSLYAFKVEKGTTYKISVEDNNSSLFLFPAKTRDYEYTNRLLVVNTFTVDGLYTIAVSPNVKKLIDFYMFIGNAQGEQTVNVDLQSDGFESGEPYYYFYGFSEDVMQQLSNGVYYLFIRLNKKYYSINIDKMFTGKLKEASSNRIEVVKKQEEEKRYKNSSEYQLKQRKEIIESNLKNYKTEKDKFDNRIFISSSKYNTDSDNVRIANANTIYIKQLLELYPNNYIFSGGFYILQKSEMNNGVTMLLKAIDFSDGDNKVRIHFGNYGLGDVGAYKYVGGNAYVLNTVRVWDESLIKLYDLLENSGNKTIYLRVFSNTESYDTVLNNACKNQMLDLLRLFRKTTKSWSETWSE